MPIENRVGHVVPTEAELRQLDADLASVVARLESFGVTISSEERRALLKPRVGGDKHVGLVVDLASELGLDLPRLTLDGLRNDLKIAAAATQLERQLSLALQVAADTRLIASSEAWRAFLVYYGALNSVAAYDAEVALRLRPVVEFMAVGPRSKKKKDG